MDRNRNKRRDVLCRAAHGLACTIQIPTGRFFGFLGDFLTYGLSLAVIGSPMRTRANVALLKGFSLLLMGSWIAITTLLAILSTTAVVPNPSATEVLVLPEASTMGVVGFIALLANLTSVLVLIRYKDGDSNVRSVWLCSRNDAIGNVAVMLAALGVWGTSTSWPDYIVAIIMASLFLLSSFQIIKQALAERGAPDMLAKEI